MFLPGRPRRHRVDPPASNAAGGLRPDRYRRKDLAVKPRLHLIAMIVTAVFAGSLVPIAVSSPASAQDQTSWYVNDDPVLWGPSRYWYQGDAGKGYGSNNYRFTYATGGESDAENWVHWYMGNRVGWQEIEAYIPHTKATATVTYHVNVGGRVHTKRLVQRTAYGWTGLGTYNTDGADVVILLADNDASQHWERDGYSASRIGVDAIRMRCVSRCSANPPPPDDRSVALGLGADRAGCSDTGLPCRWLEADFSGFSRGSYSAICYWSTSRNRLGTVFATFSSSGRDDSTFCWYNGTPGRYLTAVVDGVRSNTVQFAGTVRPPAPSIEVPSAPSFEGAVLDVREVGVAWSPPDSDGGAPITRHRVEIYRGSTRVGRTHVAASSGWMETSFTGLDPDTRYTVYVRAENSAGWGTRESVNVTTLQDSSSTTTTTTTTTTTQPQQAQRPNPPTELSGTAGQDRITINWSPPANDGGSSITGYQVELYENGTRRHRVALSASLRATNFGNLTPDTSYTVRVSADNQVGQSNPAALNIRTLAAPTGSPATDDPQQVQDSRVVELSLGSDKSDCNDQSRPCRWLDAALSGFTPGNYSLSCYWGTSSNPLVSSEYHGTIRVTGSVSRNLCWFNITPGLYVTLIIDGVQSTSIVFDGTALRDTNQNNNDLPPSMADVDTGRAIAPPPASQQLTEPSAPRNLRITLYDSNRDDDTRRDDFSVTWDPPSSSGGAPITDYRLQISREPISRGPDQRTDSWESVKDTVSPPYIFNGLTCATYTVVVSARNRAGHGPSDESSIDTECGLPSTPRNLTVRVFASGTDVRDSLLGTEWTGKNDLWFEWDSPARSGSTPITGYKIELSRGPIKVGPHRDDEGSTKTWERSLEVWESFGRRGDITDRDYWLRFKGGDYCAEYTISISAINSAGTGSTTSETVETDCTLPELPAPEVGLHLEERTLLFDAPDIVITWQPISRVDDGGNLVEIDQYQLDWRYIEYDEQELSLLFAQLDASTDDAERNSLYKKIDDVLTGDEVQAHLIPGDSQPNLDRSIPEADCGMEENQKLYCHTRSVRDRKHFDPKNPAFRINNVKGDYVLQARVRALNDVSDHFAVFGKWSPWVYIGTNWLSTVCQGISIYRTIQDVKTVLKALEWIAVSVAVVAVIVSAGASTAGGVVAREALKKAATELVRHIVKKEVLKKLFKEAIKSLAKKGIKTAAEKAGEGILRMVFDCVGHGAGLKRSEIVMLGEQSFREYHAKHPEIDDIDIDAAVSEFNELMKKSLLPW
ncbi:MAG: fibronectin type III domain-containing protein [Acidimicrobiia bacterium]|nr:fibronectin type III domain-containing protein [Acidimicrobiia bacterium]